MLLIPAASKATYSQSYCGIVKGSGHWCGASGAHSWDYNNATYLDGGTVWVCERIWDPATALPIEQNCANNITWGPYTTRTCSCYGAHVAQFSGANHRIFGYGEA